MLGSRRWHCFFLLLPHGLSALGWGHEGIHLTWLAASRDVRPSTVCTFFIRLKCFSLRWGCVFLRGDGLVWNTLFLLRLRRPVQGGHRLCGARSSRG